MSATADSISKKNPSQSVPAWLASGLLGLVLGGGATFLGMQYLGYSNEPREIVIGAPPADIAAMIARGGPMGGMMSGGSGGGGPGGGGAARAKRDLTALVGKLNLLSQGVRVELTDDQSDDLAVKLAVLETAEKMTSDQAQESLESLQAILTDEQKASIASIELPRSPRSADGGGPTDGGPPAGTGGPPGAPQPEDDNPFREEANQQRLTDLLTRLKGAPPETSTDGDQQ